MAQRSMLSFLSARGQKRSAETERSEESQPSCSTRSDSAPTQPTAAKPTDSSCTATSKGAKKFREEWRDTFTWLQTEGEGNNLTMYCEDCQKVRLKNGFTRGCRNFQRSALDEHSKSLAHKNATATVRLQPSMQAVSDATKVGQKACLEAQIRTVLCMAQEGISTSKFTSLIELQKVNGCASLRDGDTYTHHESVADMEEALYKCTKQELREKIDKSDYVGIVLDETLNCTLDKKLIVFARIVLDGCSDTVYLGNYTIDNGTAETVHSKLQEVLREWGIEEDRPRLAGLGSDGASVMTGIHNGVGARMKRLQPKLVHVHCIAHRCALAAKDATGSVDSVADYRICLQQLFKLYRSSGDRTHRLRELCETLDDTDYRCLKHPISVRWLSLGRAVTAVKNTWTALALELEEEAQRGNAAAAGLARKTKMFAFVAVTHMLADVIDVVDKLNQTFQKDNVNLATVKPMVESTIASLQQLLALPGEQEADFFDNLQGSKFNDIGLTHMDRRQAYQQERNWFIQSLIDALHARFPQAEVTVLSALAILFDVERYPVSRGEIDRYGQAELDLLVRHYTTVINAERARRSFLGFKTALSNYGLTSFDMACRCVIRQLWEQFPDFVELAKIALVIPVSSVCAERGFSLQNRIKTIARNRLSEERLTRLEMLSWHGRSVTEFDISAAREIFERARPRRK